MHNSKRERYFKSITSEFQTAPLNLALGVILSAQHSDMTQNARPPAVGSKGSSSSILCGYCAVFHLVTKQKCPGSYIRSLQYSLPGTEVSREHWMWFCRIVPCSVYSTRLWRRHVPPNRRTTWRYIQEDRTLHYHRREDFQIYVV
jgi:hypothetical protein